MGAHTGTTRTRRKSSSARRATPPLTQRHVDELRYQVGHVVEAFCDHTQKGQRVRDWVPGVVVQAEPKLVAVQFNEDVYLTDGWRIPDRILFFQQTSQHLRPTSRRRLTQKRRVRR